MSRLAAKCNRFVALSDDDAPSAQSARRMRSREPGLMGLLALK
jgi:hypothetical protein